MEKIMVITGASSGIGYKLYKLAEKNGYKCVNVSRSSNDDLNTIICDVGNEEKVKEVFSLIKQTYGKIDVIVNNAGYGISGVTELIPTQQAKDIFQTNFFGAFYCIQQALPLMQKGGKIVNISSACAIFPLPYRSLYCASKSALDMLSQSVAMELTDAKIQVVSICPGDTKTSFTKNRIKNFETNEKYNDKIITATQKLDKREEKRMSADFVASKILKITNKKTPKPQYIIGAKYKFFFFFQKLLPKKVFNKIIGKMFAK